MQKGVFYQHLYNLL